MDDTPEGLGASGYNEDTPRIPHLYAAQAIAGHRVEGNDVWAADKAAVIDNLVGLGFTRPAVESLVEFAVERGYFGESNGMLVTLG